MRATEFLIIGAGPTGLGAGHRLQGLGREEFLIVDGAAHAGGLASSYEDAQGFTWDIGGHVQFSHYRYFDQVMTEALGADGWLHHQRESWAWMRGRFVPYPVQNNIRHLPRDVVWACLEGLISVVQKGPARDRPRNFGEWILATFGEGLAREFMFPYNQKVWAYPPEDMAYQWIGERVAVTDLKRVLGNVLLERDDVSWGPNATFQFPRHGGTGAIWKRVAERMGAEHFLFGRNVVRVDTARREVSLGDGEKVSYQHLLSTMPLDRLCECLEPALSPELRELTPLLVKSSSNIVGLGMRGQVPDALRTKCWMYFPEANCPFYRVTVFSNYSPHNVPDATTHWSLMTETSGSPKKPLNPETLVEETIQGCLNTGLIQSRDEVCDTWSHHAEHGYPTPSLHRDRALGALLPALERLGVASRGRFGAWKYEVSNQDHSLMQGVEWVNRVVLGVPETTLPFPEVANANWGR